MSKNKDAKRKAKKKAMKAMPARLEQARAYHIAEAITDICKPWEFKFVEEDRSSLDGYLELWRIGMIAWDSALDGLSDPEPVLDDDPALSDEERLFIYSVVSTLMYRKYKYYPNLRSEVRDVRSVMVNGKPRLKVLLGEARDPVEIPFSVNSPDFRPTPREIVDIASKNGQTKASLAETIDETEDNLSAWEEGKYELDREKEVFLRMLVDPLFAESEKEKERKE